MTFNFLLVLAMIASGVLTVYACVGLHKLWAWWMDYSDAERCEHGKPLDRCESYHAPRPPIGTSLIGQREDWALGDSIRREPPEPPRPPKRPRGLEDDF